jgi:hypothetical protein
MMAPWNLKKDRTGREKETLGFYGISRLNEIKLSRMASRER